MAINEQAPVIGRGEVRIDAPVDVVWRLMSDIEAWPRWNPDITSARLDGALAAGTRFRWRSGPGEITSTLRAVETGSMLEWTGSTFGVRAIHVWRLRSDGDGAIVETEESWEGIPARLFRGRSQRALDDAIASGLGLLKDAAERATARS